MLVVLLPNFSKFPNFTKLSLLMRPSDPSDPLCPLGFSPQAFRLLCFSKTIKTVGP